MPKKLKAPARKPAWAKKLEAQGLKLSPRDIAAVAEARQRILARDRSLRVQRIAEMSFGSRYRSEDSIFPPPLVRASKRKAIRRA